MACGVLSAGKALQRAVGAFEDGAVGPQTLMAVTASQPHKIINRMAVYRDIYYRSLSTFDKFGKGWLRRSDETRQQSLSLAAKA
jgi:lysozyme family protein